MISIPVDRSEEERLLDLLNTTPVVQGTQQDLLDDPDGGRRWLREHGGTGTAGELRHTRAARDALQKVVRGEGPPESLAGFLRGARPVPEVTGHGVAWTLDVPADRKWAATAVLAWGTLAETRPGRLKPCANPECRLFLLDRSKANTGRWCSMAVCGNRMKARKHYGRTQQRGRTT
ncbi:CGNR zinc finger domain-containing protein [Streptomyces sp. TS71-3]|uniref:CGNR zinc finger domain-containing protein n=1 Tax=Streptomyces sp. TS71-3 TaxID=2733862 RepID=UPI001B14EB33|nr:CGNR zinc finger domain-containing protein [Streptomyces sp. TS71-3]GHJ41010.1 hypothetical protein Sm713_66190 [Streptomyces sp. TS71-3]